MLGFEEDAAILVFRGGGSLEVDAPVEGEPIVKNHLMSDDGAFREAEPAAAEPGLFLEDPVGLLVDPEGGVGGGHAAGAANHIRSGRIEGAFENPAAAAQDRRFPPDSQGMVLPEIFHLEGDAVGFALARLGVGLAWFDGFAVAGDQPVDPGLIDDEDVVGRPPGLLTAAVGGGPVVPDVFLAEIVLDTRNQSLLRGQGFLEEFGRVGAPNQVGAEEEYGGAGRNRTDE